MKAWLVGFSAVLLGVALIAGDADAARLGGGRSIGAQRSVTSAPPSSAPARQQQTQQAAPSQQPTGAAATQPKPGAQPAPATGLSRWMPLIGGLALGGLLGALIGGSGFGSMLLSWLAIAALVFGVVFVVRLLMQKRAAAAQPMQYAASGPQSGAYAALGNETVAAPPPSQISGFDARSIAAPLSSSVPAGFDVAGFVRAAKLNFMKLQLANDSGNMDELREFTTPDLYEALQKDVLGRGGVRQQTDVVSLNADLLEVVSEGNQHWASVRFSGMLREHPASAPESFEEVWNLAKPLDGSTGWLLAGIQQTH